MRTPRNNATELKPQVDRKHPDEWQRDLNPNHLAGQNIGREAEASERLTRTAYDVKSAHRAMHDMPDDELKQIPILDEGTRLRQGATYLDLERGEFTATAQMSVQAGQQVVPKDGVHYDIWNRLTNRDRR